MSFNDAPLKYNLGREVQVIWYVRVFHPLLVTDIVNLQGIYPVPQ